MIKWITGQLNEWRKKTRKENTVEEKSSGKDESNKLQAEYSLKLNIAWSFVLQVGRCIKTNHKGANSDISISAKINTTESDNTAKIKFIFVLLHFLYPQWVTKVHVL